jgi:hypothetical protein
LPAVARAWFWTGKSLTVRRKFTLLTGAAACCALLAACSGNSNSPTPTPTPTGTPTPGPTPTPTPTPTAVDFDFTKAFTAVTGNASIIYATFTPTAGGAEVWSDGSRVNGISKIEYAVSPESVKFTWPDSLALTTFTAADRQTDTPTLRSYRKGTDGITLELPFDQVLRVSYEHSENFVRETVAGILRSTRVSLFFNPVTTTSAITTNLTYTGTAKVVGGKPGVGYVLFTADPSTLTVAASDKKITGTIRIVENVNGTPTVRAVLPISATVGADSNFTGTIDDTANGFKGTFVGALAGAAREEVALIFNVAHTDGREFVGSFIGT